MVADVSITDLDTRKGYDPNSRYFSIAVKWYLLSTVSTEPITIKKISSIKLPCVGFMLSDWLLKFLTNKSTYLLTIGHWYLKQCLVSKSITSGI